MRSTANNHGVFAPITKWDGTAVTAKEDENPPSTEREMLNQSSLDEQLQEQIERTLVAPTEDDMVRIAPFPDAHTPRAMSKTQPPDFWPKGNVDQMEFKEADT